MLFYIYFSEHEGSRRMKTELLVQLDGLAKSDDLVFLLAASNLPWYRFLFILIIIIVNDFVCRELDHAMLRRLEKRVLVDLPSKEARQAMFQQFLPPTVIRESNGLVLFSDLDYVRLSNVCLINSFILNNFRFYIYILVHRRLFRCRY